jgi:hypothetical protein
MKEILYGLGHPAMFLTEEPPRTHVLDGEFIPIIIDYCSGYKKLVCGQNP